MLPNFIDYWANIIDFVVGRYNNDRLILHGNLNIGDIQVMNNNDKNNVVSFKNNASSIKKKKRREKRLKQCDWTVYLQVVSFFGVSSICDAAMLAIF